MYKVPRTYRVSYVIKSYVSGHLGRHVMEVDAFNQREAIKAVQREVERIFGCHAFHCEAKRAQ